MNYYVRATGHNQLAGGTSKWLRIRNIEKHGDSYEIEVRMRNEKKYVSISSIDLGTRFLEFAKGWPGLQPVVFRTILKEIT